MRSWLEVRQGRAVEEISGLPAGAVLARPPEQVADEIIDRHEILEPALLPDGITGQVDDQQVDVADDF